ncbi:hypothetical protein T4B_13437 [Trichinella pseudospiralis]|uniref:Uncharacterized protein n=1 Tax=Trichinella pseudospiralis TaxID=6337 RepID=A0A0V1JIZ3_TRIPS|nr:hypothetical protein T4A_11559 [Trichinella pseudospiralis]KRZ34952.1 hypothetical protein T4B_13437 [Trichinella pseudospiralis]KRZ44007.1 hypothetical protein T4C_1711 [Trichinella pseudospiralis]
MLAATFLLFISVTNALHKLTIDQLSMTDRVVSCRAHCIDAFSVGLHYSSDFACKMHADCHMCWENCGMFYHKFDIWGSICKDPVVCFSGCQLACSIYRQNLTNRSDRSMAWAFAEPMRVIRSPTISKLEVQWNAPIPLLPLSPPFPNMVYALFWKMDRRPNIWFPLNHTVGNSYVTGNVDIVHSGVDFLLLAYTRQGRIAVSQFRQYNPPKAILPLIKNSSAVNNIESPGGSRDTEFYLYLSAAIFAAAVICCVVVMLMFRCCTFFIRWKSLNRSNAIQFKRRPTIQSQDEPFSSKKKGDSTRQSTTTLASNKNLIQVSKPNRRFRKVAIPRPHTYVNVRVSSPHRFKKDDSVVNENRYSLSDCVLKILERPDGKDQILLNPYELKKRLEEHFLSTEAFQRLSKKQLNMVDHVLTCRAHCVDAFAVKMNPHSDISCQSKVECKMCWENCGMLYQKSEILNSICKDSRICFSGCQMACSIYRYDFPVHKSDQMGWSFVEPLKIIRSPEMDKLELRWDEPVPLFPISTLLPSMVYALFWKTDRRANIWFPLNHTIGNSYITNNPDIVNFGVGFLLLAYTREGRAAVIEFNNNDNLEKFVLSVENKLPVVEEGDYPDNEAYSEFYLYLGGAIFASILVIIVGAVLILRLQVIYTRLMSLNKRNAVCFKRQQKTSEENQNDDVDVAALQSTSIPIADSSTVANPSCCLKRAFIPLLPTYVNLPQLPYYVNIPASGYMNISGWQFSRIDNPNSTSNSAGNHVLGPLVDNFQAENANEQILLCPYSNLQKQCELSTAIKG